jgi:hypothetical protein
VTTAGGGVVRAGATAALVETALKAFTAELAEDDRDHDLLAA